MFLPLRAEIPQLRFPRATLVLVLVNAAVFVYELTLSPRGLMQLARAGGVVPWELSHFSDLVNAVQPRDLVPPPFTILTSLFIHGDVFHLGGNLWFLWVFGTRLEGLLGARKFLLLFFAAGTVAAILQVMFLPSSTLPMIGASGAIAGVLGGHARAFPREPVRTLLFVLFFVTVIRLPAAVMLGMWFAAQFVSVGGHEPGVAWYAHIGGFTTGLALASVWCAQPGALRRRFGAIGYHRVRERNRGEDREREDRGGGIGDRPAWPHAPVPAT